MLNKIRCIRDILVAFTQNQYRPPSPQHDPSVNVKTQFTVACEITPQLIKLRSWILNCLTYPSLGFKINALTDRNICYSETFFYIINYLVMATPILWTLIHLSITYNYKILINAVIQLKSSPKKVGILIFTGTCLIIHHVWQKTDKCICVYNFQSYKRTINLYMINQQIYCDVTRSQ